MLIRGVHGTGFLTFFGPGIFLKLKSRDFLVPGFLCSENPGIFQSRDFLKIKIPGFLVPGFSDPGIILGCPGIILEPKNLINAYNT